MSALFSFIQFLFPRLSTLLSPCLIVILLLILQKTAFHDFRKTFLYILFSMYMIAVFRVTGIPDSLHMHFDPRLQLIPFFEVKEDLFNCFLNVFLFVPFGFFLPALWKQFFTFRNTVLTAFAFTAVIEISQIFCHRLTDVNDLIFNTLGALIGFGILKLVTHFSPKLFQNEFKKRECVLIFAITFSMVFFLDPVIYNFLFEHHLLPSYYIY